MKDYEESSDILGEEYKNLPCPSPDCNSSDAYWIYTDHAFCFSCKKYFPPEEVPELNDAAIAQESPPKKKEDKVTDMKDFKRIAEIQDYDVKGFATRKIHRIITDFYDCRVGYDEDGEVSTHYYPFHSEDGKVIGYKVRNLPKDFYAIGRITGLFGRVHFPGGGKRIIVTEGEIDCLSVAQASLYYYREKNNKRNKTDVPDVFYPVVSLPNGASSKKYILQEREYLRSFDEVVLCYDQDEPGQEAAKEHSKIIGVDKCKIAELPEKDANATMHKHGMMAIMRAIWDAEAWSPAGILTKDELWQDLVECNAKETTPYPSCIGQLNTKLKGRCDGEITLWISGTGAGKSTMVREIALHERENTNNRIGIISLEERPGDTARELCAMYMNKNPSEEEILEPELKPVFDYLFDNERVRILNHYESEGTIMETMEQFAVMGYNRLILDHITLLAAESEDEGRNENARIDAIMSRMRRLVKQHDVHVDVISQLRKMGESGKSFENGVMPSLDDIKGSGSIKQCSFNIIASTRNMSAEDDLERNTINMAVLKCRRTGLTGPVKPSYYSYEHNRIESDEPDEYTKQVFSNEDDTEEIGPL